MFNIAELILVYCEKPIEQKLRQIDYISSHPDEYELTCWMKIIQCIPVIPIYLQIALFLYLTISPWTANTDFNTIGSKRGWVFEIAIDLISLFMSGAYMLFVIRNKSRPSGQNKDALSIPNQFKKTCLNLSSTLLLASTWLAICVTGYNSDSLKKSIGKIGLIFLISGLTLTLMIGCWHATRKRIKDTPRHKIDHDNYAFQLV